MNTDNKNIKYGTEDVLPPGVEYSPKDVKVKISMFLDGDVLKACKAHAEKKHTGYQTLINQLLREILIDKKPSEMEIRIHLLEAKFNAFMKHFGERSFEPSVAFGSSLPKKKRSKKVA